MSRLIRAFKFFGSLCCCLAIASMSHADLVRFDTNFGSFNVDLFEDTQPLTVANFMFYLDQGQYTNSIFHRSVGGAIVQGGGFYNDLSSVPTTSSVVNEPGRSNLRGTIAMAKVAGDPDSATSQWYFNLTNNIGLDSDNGGFTVFGEVLGNGLNVLDQIAALDTITLTGGNPQRTFQDFPVTDTASPITSDDLVIVNSIQSIPEPAGLTLMLIPLALSWRRRRTR